MSRREQLQQMLQDNADDPFLLYALALEDRSAGHEDEALAGLDRVLAVDSRYVAAYFQKGQILAGQENYAEARDALQKGIAVASEVGDAHAEGEMTEFLAALP